MILSRYFLARPNIIKRNKAPALLTLHVSMRPIAENEPVLRKGNLSMPKIFKAEGTPNEIIIEL